VIGFAKKKLEVLGEAKSVGLFAIEEGPQSWI
jgi:hypothetical protein